MGQYSVVDTVQMVLEVPQDRLLEFFCDAVSQVPLPVTVTLITRYVAYLVSLRCAYSQILNHLSSIKHIHKLLGHELN